MTYSIINTQSNSGETLSTHRTLRAAWRAWETHAYVREYRAGQWQRCETTASRDYKIRNNATGQWVGNEEI